MGLARLPISIMLLALVPATSPASDDATRCKAAILKRGTTLFAATTTIDELITCLQCVGDEVVDAGVAVAY